MHITDETLLKIRKNKRLKRAMIDYFDISERTLYRWFDEKNSRLTEIGCLAIISTYLQIDISTLIDEPIHVSHAQV
jgi:hypothetical protein